MKEVHEKIQWLLHESHITVYRIAKETGINNVTLYKYIQGKSEIENMTLNNAMKLYEFAKKEEVK